jgi:hypothetical protein
MNRLKTIFILVIVAFLLLIGVFFYGRQQGKQAATTKEEALNVSSQLILDRITSQYFLVTKSVFVDSKAEIETPKSNDWKDLFTGSKITVRGIIRVDVGVDMKGLTVDNVVVDPDKKTVTISLPKAAVLDSSLFGELDVEVDKAIVDKIKGLFKNTQKDDYNLAIQTLQTNATDRVSSDGSIFNEARADSIKLVELIVTSMLKDYKVIVE